MNARVLNIKCFWKLCVYNSEVSQACFADLLFVTSIIPTVQVF